MDGPGPEEEKEQRDMIPLVILSMEDDGDRAFMTEIYLQYECLIWSEIRKLLKDEHDPEAVFQDCLVKLVRHVKKLRSMERRNMVNYLITVVKNTCMDVLRQKRVYFESINDEEWSGRYTLRSDEDLEALAFRREAVSQLAQIWPLLDERSRYLLEGKYFLDLSTHEMGAVLNITHDSVRVELFRARTKARKLLEEHFPRSEE